jgi:hypothetical protein
VIIGDNADVYRAVGTSGAPGSAFLKFNYDNYDVTTSIIPRSITLIDYTPGTGSGSDKGAADVLHGEAGDDQMYGMVGADALYGEGQDDDLYGGAGADWISGGTGDDGILGDDGKIMTSQNGAPEPLYGVTALLGADLNLIIATPGNMQQATINVAGKLKKSVDLEPFADGGNDILYGGLGNDAIHGGAGNDAMSGAEALAGSGPQPDFYGAHVNSGDVLAFGRNDPTRFPAYDQNNPMVKIAGFLLNFDAAEGPQDPRSVATRTDGDDVIFGDTGNDWAVGGTGNDHVFGGLGDDLLNVDDNQDTNGGKNDVPDTDPGYADIAYGGGGRDVLIDNTGGDRLIDWVGEFNGFITPYAPFGSASVSRTLQPQLAEYLYALSKSDGSDQTRVGTGLGTAARNGEPFGELGLTLQQDTGWQTQTGGPNDPQAGNSPGVKRDVRRYSDFGVTAAAGWVVQSGKWAVSSGVYTATPSTTGGASVSLNQLTEPLASSSELLASVNLTKPAKNASSNGYVIFDYVSPTNFKFAGIDATSGKLRIGHRTSSGWVSDAQANLKVSYNVNYALKVSLEGSKVSVTVNGGSLLSFNYGVDLLTDGKVGLGTNGSTARFDNYEVAAYITIV